LLVLLENTILANFTLVGLTLKAWNGERSCLIVAIDRDDILATDDQLDPRAAPDHERMDGAISILKTCIQAKLLSRIDSQPKLDENIAAGYHSPVLKLDFD
jgi:predicted nucleic acid-binding protein